MLDEARIRNLLHSLPLPPSHLVPPEQSRPPGATDSELDQLQAALGFNVPADLRTWLKMSNGPLLNSCDGVSTHGILQIYEGFPKWQQKRWIPLVGNGAGDFYVLATAHDSAVPPVLFSDQGNIDEPSFVAASSLPRFLVFLLEDEAGLEKRWPFNEAYVLQADPAIRHLHEFPMPWQD